MKLLILSIAFLLIGIACVIYAYRKANDHDRQDAVIEAQHKAEIQHRLIREDSLGKALTILETAAKEQKATDSAAFALYVKISTKRLSDYRIALEGLPAKLRGMSNPQIDSVIDATIKE